MYKHNIGGCCGPGRVRPPDDYASSYDRSAKVRYRYRMLWVAGNRGLSTTGADVENDPVRCEVCPRELRSKHLALLRPYLSSSYGSSIR
jgi:hypothetical protein